MGMTMTLADSSPDDSLAVKWAELRRRRRIRWIAFFAWAPLAFALVELMEALFGHAFADRYFGFVAFPSLLVGFGFMIYGSTAKCPVCGKSFESRRYLGGLFAYHNAFTRRCLSCRAAIGEPQKDA
jgi:hypothetical protein